MPADVISGMCDFPDDNIEVLICNPNSNHKHINMLNESNNNCKLVKISWMNKNQYDWAKRNPENQMVDATSKANNQGCPLRLVNGADGEYQSILALIALLHNERLNDFYFMLLCLGFICGKKAHAVCCSFYF